MCSNPDHQNTSQIPTLEVAVPEPINAAVAIVPTKTGQGYYMVFADGGVLNFGDATYFGSMAGEELYAPVVAAACTPSGKGYWLLAADGGVFCFGDAQFLGTPASS